MTRLVDPVWMKSEVTYRFSSSFGGLPKYKAGVPRIRRDFWTIVLDGVVME